MTIALPIAVGGRLVGTGVLVDRAAENLFFATCLHLFGEGNDIRIAIPPHGGNCTATQPYPLAGTPALAASVVAIDPFSDIAILHTKEVSAMTPPMPPIATSSGLIPVGTEVVVLGYPFAPIGSFLETWTPSYVTAIAQRHITPVVMVDEIVLSATAHPGSSGSAVMGKKDGVLYGIVRGALAPPEVLRIGDIPIATDTSVTFATSAHVIHELLKTAKLAVEIANA
jgi:S1-C subfamily serine protease